MWVDFNDKLINLEQCREIKLMSDQFGHKVIRIDNTDYDIKNAEQIYKQIKEHLIQEKRSLTK